MIGLVLVTHGRLAVEFRAALEHVVGAQEQIETVTIGPDDDVEQRRRDIIEAVKRADSGDGVVILTDMFGGTPSNLSISVMNRPNVEVLAGINLPMLVKLAKVRADCPLRSRSPPRRRRARNTSPSRAACLPGNERLDQHPDGAVTPRHEDRQREGPARARLGEVRAAGRRSRREVTVSRNGETRGGDSIMGLMMLAAGIGTSITVSATGREAKHAIDALDALVSGKFGEEE